MTDDAEVLLEIIRLHSETDLPWEEIGERVGLSGEATRSRWRRWKKRKENVDTLEKGASFTEDKNTATAQSISSRITTLPQLLEACEVDLDVWLVDHYIVNKWEVGAKAEQKNLTWTGGIIDGYVKADGLTVEPLFQVKVWLVRKNPIPIFPHIQPVQATTKFKKPPAPSKKGIRRELLWSDPQWGFHRSTRSADLKPFHCRRTIDCILQIAIAAQVDGVCLLGDSFDLPEWSDRFLKDPQFYWSTQPSLEEGHWTLARFRLALPSIPMWVHEGNHDERMRRALLRHLPAAYDLRQAGNGCEAQWGVLSVPYLLDLEGLGIEYVDGYPDDVRYLNEGALVRHGNVVRAHSNATSLAVAKNATVTEFQGHDHRLGMAFHTRWPSTGPEIVAAVSIGCACRIDGTVPGSKIGDQWQNGCCIVDYEVDGKMVDANLILIENGEAIWNGQKFIGRDYVEDLRRDVPKWNWV